MFSQGYLIDTQLCIAALWLFYIAVLHRRTQLAAARIYLLALVPAGLLLPLLRIPLLPAPEIAASPVMIGTLPPLDLPPTAAAAPKTDWTPWILGLLYGLGVLVFAALMIVNMFRTHRQLNRTVRGEVIFSQTVAGAYSVFGRIFVNDKFKDSPLLGQILAHERSHIGHRHSLDLLWMSLGRALLWFNPLVWHTFRMLREVHEFQADRDVIRQGNPVVPYVELLIGTEAGIYPGTANGLCYALTKKRLKMIAQATCGAGVGGYLRLAALVPLTGLLLGAFSLTAQAAESVTPQPLPAVPAAPVDTLRRIELHVERIPDTLDLRVEPVAEAPDKNLNMIDLDVRRDTTSKANDADSHPLFVVDGIIVKGAKSFDDIKPKSYRQITVLKGESATKTYGEQGRNGVIVITTDRQENQSGVKLSGQIAIQNGELRMPQESFIGTSGSFDSINGRRVTVRISKSERKKGITAAAKLLEEHPDLFYATPEGGVTNREPVSVSMYNEE